MVPGAVLPSRPMSGQDEKQEQVGFKAPPSSYARWKSDAAAAGISFNAHAIRALDGASMGLTGTDGLMSDPEFRDALDSIGKEYGSRPGPLIRMAVIAACRRMKAGLDPFRLARPSGEPEPAATGRPSRGAPRR